MQYRPSEAFIDLLQRLQLVEAGQWAAFEGEVRSMSADLPAFESVWIDLLRQARLITQFQAAALRAGQGESLLVDRYVLYELSDDCYYAASYRARPLDTEENVRLTLFPIGDRAVGGINKALEGLVTSHRKLSPNSTMVVQDAGVNAKQAWAAGPWTIGMSAAQSMLRRGRFDPSTALEIAKAMTEQLAGLELRGLCHGNISAHSLVILEDGSLQLPQAGLRAIARPSEGFAHVDIRPEACDGLSPERVADGSRPSIASDIFACGCLWWHLLCGRPSFGGGDSLSRLRAAHDAKIAPVGQWASNVPESLIGAITAATRHQLADRPKSFGEIAKILGNATRQGQQRIAAAIAQEPSLKKKSPAVAYRRSRSFWTAQKSLTVSVGLIAFVAFAWPVWVAMTRNDRRAPLAQHSTKAVNAKFAATPTAPPGASDAHRITDPSVAQASYTSTGQQADSQASFDWKKPLHSRDIPLRPGCKVAAPNGQRMKILVPSTGWRIACEQTCFVNVDFVAEATAGFSDDANHAVAVTVSLLNVEADQIEFLGCTFSGGSNHAVAVHWLPSATGQDSALSLPTGRIRVKNSIFNSSRTGLLCDRRGALNLEMNNVLALGGSCMAVTHCPGRDDPIRISLYAVTTREAEACIALCYPTAATAQGEITVDATSCVFSAKPGAPLILFQVPEVSASTLNSIRWTGQGSLLGSKMPFAQWILPDGTAHPIDDSNAKIAGLVRDDVSFASPIAAGVTSCRVVGWQAPLQSPDAPGAMVEQLPSSQ